MFERFTESARQVVVLSQEEARTLRHGYIGTEHLLLGLVREEDGLAARVLANLGLQVEHVRAQVVRIVGSGEEARAGQIPFTPRAKKVLELALREALSLGNNYIGPEHILLALGRETESVGTRIMRDLDADPEKVRNAVMYALSGSGALPGPSGRTYGPGPGPRVITSPGPFAAPTAARLAASEPPVATRGTRAADSAASGRGRDGHLCRRRGVVERPAGRHAP